MSVVDEQAVTALRHAATETATEILDRVRLEWLRAATGLDNAEAAAIIDLELRGRASRTTEERAKLLSERFPDWRFEPVDHEIQGTYRMLVLMLSMRQDWQTMCASILEWSKGNGWA